MLQKETKFHIFLFRETQNFRETGEAFVSFRFSRNFKKAKIKNPSDASSQEWAQMPHFPGHMNQHQGGHQGTP